MPLPISLSDEAAFAAASFGVLDSVPAGAFVLREDLTVLFWNACLVNWSGIAKNKITGAAITTHFPHLNQGAFQQRLRQIFAGGPPVIFSSQLHQKILPIPLWNGKERIQQTTAVAVDGMHKSGHYALFTIQDVTDLTHHIQEFRQMRDRALNEVEQRKKIESELRLYKDNLEKVVEQRTAELQKTHRQLLHAEKLSATGKLAASIAHEIGNPISGVHSVLAQIKEDAALDPQCAKLAELAIRECHRIFELIHKLRDFHRPSADVALPVSIHNAIDDMALLCAKRLGERKVILKKEYAPETLLAMIVPDQIKQVILNLIQNAEEAIPEGGGEITIATEALADSVRIAITDTGCGVAPSLREQIFEPFFTTKTPAKGTGLGLYVSYNIIRQHGGDIEIQSEPGRGATFIITLPKARASL